VFEYCLVPCLVVVTISKYHKKDKNFPLLVRPKTIVFGRTYVLPQMFLLFFIQREISEMGRPIDVKFCTVIHSRPCFIMPVQNFEELSPKKFRSQKHVKFGPISDDFEVRRWISPKRMKIFKTGSAWSTAIPPTLGDKSPVNFGPLITEILMWNHTHQNRLFGRPYFGL